MVRLKNRYLLVHILYPGSPPGSDSRQSKNAVPDVVQFHQPTPDSLTPQLLTRAIRDEVSMLFGEYGAGVTVGSLSVKYLSTATSTAIIKCSRAHYRLVWAALSFMTTLPKKVPGKTAEQACVFQVVRVSGTIRKAEEEAIRRARVTIMKARKDSKDGAPSALEALLAGGLHDHRNHPSLQNQQDRVMDIDDDDEEHDDGE